MQRVSGREAELIERRDAAVDDMIPVIRARSVGLVLQPFVQHGANQPGSSHVKHWQQRGSLIFRQQPQHQAVPEYAVTKPAHQTENLAQRGIDACAVEAQAP